MNSSQDEMRMERGRGREGDWRQAGEGIIGITPGGVGNEGEVWRGVAAGGSWKHEEGVDQRGW